uniref:Putative DNA polymerase n=1 Tax=viral metagenome TaxID=1070528 RepID=A0A6M3XI89_9ZZZZ
MKFKVNRKELVRILQLVKPLVTTIDFKSITDSIYMSVKDNILVVRVVGEEVIIQANVSVESDTDMQFLTNAIKLINMITRSDVDTVSFTLQGTNIEEGLGSVKIKANSQATLPLRNLNTYPEVIDSEKIVYTKIDESFLDDIMICSKFVDKKSQNFRSGINISKNFMIATNDTSAFFIIRESPVESFTTKFESFKALYSLNNIVIGFSEEPLLVLFKGNIEDISVYMAASIFNEDYPYKDYIKSAKEWRSSPTYKVKIDKNTLQDTIRRLDGFVTVEYSRIKILVDKNKMVLDYQYQSYENEEIIECESEDEFGFSVDINRLKEILMICSNEIELNVSKDRDIMLLVQDKQLYCGSIFDRK